MKKIQYDAEKGTANVVEANALDIVTTTVSTTEVLPGMPGLLQRGALFLGGMALQNWFATGSALPSFRKA